MIVLICYRNPGSHPHGSGSSHGGLVNNAMWTLKMLRSIGVDCRIARVWNALDIEKAVLHNQATHCVIEAQFLATNDLRDLICNFPNVKFVQRCHSQVPFLATAPNDIKLLLEYLYLQDASHNLQVGSNSTRFNEWIEEAYRQHCLFLPNAYIMHRPGTCYHPPKVNKDTIKVGCFGAIRILKNQATAAAAALMMARRLGKSLEFYMNAGREEKGNGVLQSIKNMFKGLHWAKLHLIPWADWAHFNQLVSTMDLCYQLSSTETFNLCSADACANGVPSVVGDAIEWCPPSWMAEIDSPVDASRVGINLLTNPLAILDGQKALEKYCEMSIRVWKKWLGLSPC